MAGEDIIYKIVTAEQWQRAEETGRFEGAPVDIEDGYIHFSTAGQVRETAAKHFSGQIGLLLLRVSTAALAGRLRYEPSRGGQLFPHLYGDLSIEAVIGIDDLPLGADGRHRFPDDLEAQGRSGGPTIR
ncbi:MAG: DUF952 domain-containing protein [Geminicoccaceae bacterium]